MPLSAVEHGEAILIVIGIGFSTFVAHLFAAVVGSQVDPEHADRENSPLNLLRDSLPILMATAVPLALLLVAWLDLLDSVVALRLAELYCIARIGLTGFYIRRHLGRPATAATWLTSILLAVVGAVVVGLKIHFGHG